MASILYVLFEFIDLCINAVMVLMFVRAILSWFPMLGSGGRLMQFIYMVTEFFIAPVRNFMSRFKGISGMPIDLSFIVTYILLAVIQTIITSLSYSILY